MATMGIIGRFKPFHNGHLRLLEAACNLASHVTIGLGSSNKYNRDNPFTAEESKEMIQVCLPYSNYSFVFIPDKGDKKLWRESFKEIYGSIDYIVTDNTWVEGILKNDYKVMHPSMIVKEEDFQHRATEVREAMLDDKPWEHMVPNEVAKYMKDRGLDEHFRRDFSYVLKII